MIRCVTKDCGKLIMGPEIGGDYDVLTMVRIVRCSYCKAEYRVTVERIHRGEVPPYAAQRSTD